MPDINDYEKALRNMFLRNNELTRRILSKDAEIARLKAQLRDAWRKPPKPVWYRVWGN